MKRNILILSIVLLPACATIYGPGNPSSSSLTEQEKNIQVFDSKADATAACKEIKELDVIDAASGTSLSEGSYNSTVVFLKRKAAPLGANAIYIMSHSKVGMADKITAKAIRCSK